MTLWDRIDEIVDRVEAAPASEREAILREECGDDAALRTKVETILDAPTPPRDFLDPTACPFGPGDVLGPYELLRRLGAGGMGEVFLARKGDAADDDLGAFVALKIMTRKSAESPALRARFAREVNEGLPQHAGIVAAVEHGETDGVPWCAMTYVDGHDLAREIRIQLALAADGSAPERPLLPRHGSPDYLAMVCECVASVADGLDHCHRNGIFHRDVKPANLLVDRGGGFHLTDFGIAKHVDLASLTNESVDEALGTLAYMSPEQARAMRDPVSAASDVYSLGIVLYELLALQPPVEARTTKELIARVATGRLERLAKTAPLTPRDLVVIVETCLAWRPGDRYASAAELADDLRRFVRHEAIVARPLSAPKRVGVWFAQRPVVLATLGTAVVLALIAWGVVHARLDGARRERWTAALQEAIRLRDWADDVDAVVRARDALAEARARDDVDGRVGDLVAVFEARAARDADDRAHALGRGFVAAKGAALPDVALLAPPNMRALQEAVRDARIAERLHPDDERLAELAAPDAGWAAVEVALADDQPSAGDATGPAVVHARSLGALDGSLGELRELGTLDGEPLRVTLAPGSWRLVVELPGVGFAEFDRSLEPSNAPLELAARVPAAADVEATFVRVPGAEITFADDEGDVPLGCCLAHESLVVAPFWISATEVSNREYLEFLDATGHAAPIVWRDCGYDGDWRALPGVDGDEAFLDLPATGMGYRDMQAYAAWRGLRLATHFELELALRGPQMATAPFAPGVVDVPWTDSVDDPDDDTFAYQRARFRRYVHSARPVDDPQYRQPPYGLYHVFGNAIEVTSSSVHVDESGVLTHLPRHRVAFGPSYASDLSSPFDGHSVTTVVEPYASPKYGFRLARSDDFRNP